MEDRHVEVVDEIPRLKCRIVAIVVAHNHQRSAVHER